jgi:hypothetical protein
MRRVTAAIPIALAAIAIACTNNHHDIAQTPPGRTMTSFHRETPPAAPATPVLDLQHDADLAQSIVDAVTAPVPSNGACPAGMIEIEGTYCPNVQETCLYWVDYKGNRSEAARPSKKFPTGRCGEWKYPSTCLTPVAKRPHMHFCVDTYEYPNVEGQRPQSWMDWYSAKNACAAQGKRLCTKEEWTFSCEGPDMQPYPYAGPGEHPGYTRDRTACNFDNPIPEDPLRPGHKISVFDAKKPGDRVSSILQDLLVPAGSMPACVSPFGVHDMVGNIDELIDNTAIPEHSKKAPFRSGLMSGHVFGVRNQCRAITDGHNEWFGWYETGTRCCEDAK